MDLVLLVLSCFGLAVSVGCLVVGVYSLRRHHRLLRRHHLPAIKMPLKTEERKPEEFLAVVRKASDALEGKESNEERMR